MRLWGIFSVLIVAVNCQVQPGIFYYPTPESEEPASQVSEQRTFFRGSTLKGSVKCLGDALKTQSNYTLHVWSFKTKCYSTVLDSVTQQRVSRYVNFFLGQSGNDVDDYTSDCHSTRCFSMEITCDSARPTIPEIGSTGARLCPGYQSIQAECLKPSDDKADDAAPADSDEKAALDAGEEEKTAADGGSRRKRDTSQKVVDTVKEITKGADSLSSIPFTKLVDITKTGSYYIGWSIEPRTVDSIVDRENIQLIVKARDENLGSYLEAKDYPLLIFYGVSSGVYALLALIWLIVCGIHWRDILQIQLWIGGMIALTMIEMSVFCSKYQSVNNGKIVPDSLVIFAELLQTFKHALSRVLILIICMGYGIVKPRLGSTKHLVFALGLAYCLFVSIDGIYTQLYSQKNPLTSRQRLYAHIPRAVINAILIWWIIASLVATIRTLRMRRNVIKLNLYRHFSNALAFAIVSLIAFQIWWINLTRDGCIQNWREYWLSEDIFWNILFTMILIMIMFLWRPTINNSRYAFSPLLDTDEDEDEEETIHEAFEGMKLRNIKKNGGERSSRGDRNVEDDLKWVEENIPSAMGDTVFERLMDSDEEVEHKRYEMSKMQ